MALVKGQLKGDILEFLNATYIYSIAIRVKSHAKRKHSVLGMKTLLKH